MVLNVGLFRFEHTSSSFILESSMLFETAYLVYCKEDASKDDCDAD
jgi:Ni,Fe-hydrogenase I cytochrome b subunit